MLFLRRPLMMAVSVCLAGCASKGAYVGHSATDLSGIKPGLPRTDVERILGPSARTEVGIPGLRAWYVYDRGYVGTLEEKSALEKVGWAPILAWGEMVSLGVAGLMTVCATPCQKGFLTVTYGPDNGVVSASEQYLPDDHPEVSACRSSGVRADHGVCAAVRERVRPTSLPSEVQP